MTVAKRRSGCLLAAFIILISAGAALAQAPQTGAAEVMTIGQGTFRAPESVVHDEEADVYLVSNVNGELTDADDNGFISRVSPDGKIIDLKWIDGAASRETTLHGPKDMLLTEEHLIVADVGAIRYFDRRSGAPVRSIVVPESHMLNALALDPDGRTVYVTDTGGKTFDKPGAIYRIDEDGKRQVIASGPDLERPNGIAWHNGALLFAPFGQHARQLYRMDREGKTQPGAMLPQPELDGLIALPDGAVIVTSWKGKTVYRVKNNRVEVLVDGVRTPAQIGHDGKRNRLLVPALKENELTVYALDRAG